VKEWFLYLPTVATNAAERLVKMLRRGKVEDKFLDTRKARKSCHKKGFWGRKIGGRNEHENDLSASI
jgi:hypothetical protein